jgi:hydrogenase maturation protein HypF
VSELISRVRIEFEGIVQGVGFRPFLHRLAEELRLPGWVLNSSAGVLMELEGPAGLLEEYIRRVQAEAPALSRILVTRARYLPPLGFSNFAIKPSRTEVGALTLLCPDVATCPDCLRELFDPADQRYRYPFINCTNCGPRYTIVRALPYDRPQTTMAGFALCPECRREYEDVNDRRYHAQPIACPVCGPRLWFETPDGARLDVDPLSHAVDLLKRGAVLAIKGLGGFHLACRADADEAVLALRRSKQRSYFKPLAVMAPNIDAVRRLCEVDAPAEEWLCSPIAPIVLLRLQPQIIGSAISRYVAPNLDRLGVMLPYTPLHHILLADTGVPLVMTSGNSSDDPIVADNAVAREKLGPLVDGLLLHDRPVHARCDDSVIAADASGACTVLRHSRGFSPFPVALPDIGPDVLAFGGDIKTTFAASRERFAFLSPHLGDAEQLATYGFFRETWEHYKRLFNLRPAAVACDMHPGYRTVRWAAELAAELAVPLIKVQHHHAHLAALLTEHGLQGAVPAIVADGTGYGEDGTLWGGELLFGDERSFERVAHLRPLMLPGGDEATLNPWRIALALVHAAAPEEMPRYVKLLQSGELCARVQREQPLRLDAQAASLWQPPEAGEVELVQRMLEQGVGVVASTALGRLFDGIAALLGVTLHTTYEGQAPMELEAAAGWAAGDGASGSWTESHAQGIIDWAPLVRTFLCEESTIAGRAQHFHAWVAEAFLSAVAVDDRCGKSRIILASGGCMQNSRLKRLLGLGCQRRGRQLLTHREIPAGDGGLALGILRVAQARLMLR